MIRRGQDPLAPPRMFGNAEYLALVGLTDEARAQFAYGSRLWPKNNRRPPALAMFAVDGAPPIEGEQIRRELVAAYPAWGIQNEIWTGYFAALRCACGQPAAAAAIHQAVLKERVNPSLALGPLTRLGRLDSAFEIAERLKPGTMMLGFHILFAPIIPQLTAATAGPNATRQRRDHRSDR